MEETQGNSARGRRSALAVMALVGTAVGMLVAAGSLYARGGSPADVVVRPGETLAVSGTSVACTVRRRDGVTGLECEARPRARGTLGARVSTRRIAVYEFLGDRTAKTLFSARERRNGNVAVCRGR